MRPLVEELPKWLGGEHLPARRANEAGELRKETGGEPVAGHHDHVGVELVDEHGVTLAHVRSCGHSVRGQAPDPTRRLERPVGRVEDRAEVEAVERRCELVDPFDGEPVLSQRVVLSPQRVPLGLVVGESEAADASKRVACKLLHPVERPLGDVHDEPGALLAQ